MDWRCDPPLKDLRVSRRQRPLCGLCMASGQYACQANLHKPFIRLIRRSSQSPCFLQHRIMSVTLHTTHGDLKIEIFCESVPNTAEVRCSFASSIAFTADRAAEFPCPLRLLLLHLVTIPSLFPRLHDPGRLACRPRPQGQHVHLR